MGGGGVGPGEVRFLFSVDRVRGDTVVVGGWPIGSPYWFDEEGSFVRDQLLGPWYPGMLGRTLPDGSLILDTYDFGSYGNTLENWAANGPDEDIRPAGIVEFSQSPMGCSRVITTRRLTHCDFGLPLT